MKPTKSLTFGRVFPKGCHGAVLVPNVVPMDDVGCLSLRMAPDQRVVGKIWQEGVIIIAMALLPWMIPLKTLRNFRESLFAGITIYLFFQRSTPFCLQTFMGQSILPTNGIKKTCYEASLINLQGVLKVTSYLHWVISPRDPGSPNVR